MAFVGYDNKEKKWFNNFFDNNPREKTKLIKGTRNIIKEDITSKGSFKVPTTKKEEQDKYHKSIILPHDFFDNSEEGKQEIIRHEITHGTHLAKLGMKDYNKFYDKHTDYVDEHYGPEDTVEKKIIKYITNPEERLAYSISGNKQHPIKSLKKEIKQIRLKTKDSDKILASELVLRKSDISLNKYKQSLKGSPRIKNLNDVWDNRPYPEQK